MRRYFTLILGALLFLGDGCHKATGPIDNGKNSSYDSTVVQLGLYEQSVNCNFKNILIIGYSYYARDNNTPSESRDTALVPAGARGILISSESRIIKNKISIYNDRSFNSSDWGQDFRLSDVTFKYQPDSSINIVLDGKEAENHLDFSDYNDHTGLTGGGVNGTYLETKKDHHSFYKCTDSTHIEIILHKK